MPQLVLNMEVNVQNKNYLNLKINRFNPPVPKLRRAGMLHAAYSNHNIFYAKLRLSMKTLS